MWMPGTLVAIGLNSPRTSAGASGFRSHMSCVAAPPSRYSRMTFFALPGRAAAGLRSSAASRFGRVNAAAEQGEGAGGERLAAGEAVAAAPRAAEQGEHPGAPGEGREGSARRDADDCSPGGRSSDGGASGLGRRRLYFASEKQAISLSLRTKTHFSRERRVAPDDLATERRPGRLDQLRLVDLLVPLGARAWR